MIEFDYISIDRDFSFKSNFVLGLKNTKFSMQNLA